MREIEVVADVVFADLPDGGVVVHTGTKRYYSLNQTGARIWGLLERSGDLAVTASTLAAEYGISSSEATRAVDQLADGLLAAGLVRKVAQG
jgi:Coenzyme PQQ synthesis protein D (PqqD)